MSVGISKLSELEPDSGSLVHDAFALEVDRHGAFARTAQVLSALRRATAVFRVVVFRTLFSLRPGFRPESGDLWGFTSPSSAIGCPSAR